MAGAWDRTTPKSDHDPLANLLNFEGGMLDTVKQAGGLIGGLTQGLQAIIDLIKSALQGIDLTQAGSVILAMVQRIGQAFGDLLNGLLSAFTGSTTGGGDLSALQFVIGIPLQLLSGTFAALNTLQQQVGAALAGLTGRIQVIENNTGGSTAAGAFDDFNRPTIGSTWKNVQGTLAIYAPGGYVQTPAFAAGYVEPSPLAPVTEKHAAKVKLVNKYWGSCRIFICSDTTMSNYAALEVRAGYWGDDYARIITGSSPTDVVAQVQKDLTIDPGWVFDLLYDPATNMFIVTVNDAPLLTWVDSTNLVTHGPTKRRTGIVSNAENLPGVVGFAFTDFTPRDW